MASTTAKRIGVFGGTFDPVHLGHLILAEQCREQGRLDEVWFVPAGNPPHKQGQEVAPFDRRVEMIALATAGNPAFRIEPIEKEHDRPSFTADTLEALHRRHPDTELFLLIGSDSLADLPNWHDPVRVLQHATLLVMLRTTTPLITTEYLQASLKMPADMPLRLQSIAGPPLIDISSRDLRQRIADGRSIRYLTTRAVECYIQEKGLYRAGGTPIHG